MPHYKITPKSGGEIYANIWDNAEDVKYSDCAIDFHAKSIAPALLALIEAKLGPCRFPSVLQNINNTAYAIAKEQVVEEMRKVSIPEGIKTILDNDGLKKKEQISLLKGVSITAEQLGAIFLYGEEKGFLFSNFRVESEPKQINPKDVPSFIRLLDDGKVDYTGKTPLTEGQLRSIVNQSNFIVARFLVKDSVWHCFVQDRNGIMGNEKGKMGSIPHLHYFSSGFGLDLADVKTAILNGSYPHTSAHIPLVDYKP